MSNQVQVIQDNAAKLFAQQFPIVVARGIDESTWTAITTTIFPGCSPDSALMAVDYCRARNIDILMKPVHIVPMWDPKTRAMRDVVMPGIGLYRIQADRSGNYAGNDEPNFGDMITTPFIREDGSEASFKHPESCTYTVYKIIGGNRVAFTAKEYWVENYAVKSKKDSFPNAMWSKRPMAQLAKCAEAQALRKAWPEIGSQPTYDEMEGKSLPPIDITPAEKKEINEVKNQLLSQKKIAEKEAVKAVEKKVTPEPEAEQEAEFEEVKDQVEPTEFEKYEIQTYEVSDKASCGAVLKKWQNRNDFMTKEEIKKIGGVVKALHEKYFK